MIIKLLLDTRKDENGQTPLGSVARNGDETILKVYLTLEWLKKSYLSRRQLILDVMIAAVSACAIL